MNAKTQSDSASFFDTVKLALSLAILVGGMVAYYWFPQWPLPLRVLTVLVATAAGIGLAFTTAKGAALWKFIQGSRIEIRKVVWPTKQETTQTTIAVFIFTFVLGLFFWILDAGLLWVTSILTGRG